MSPTASTSETELVTAPTPSRPKTAFNGKASPDNRTNESWQVVLLPVGQIAPCPFQPRLVFDEAEMEELTASVKAHGVQQPILVRSTPTKTNPIRQTPAKAKEQNGSTDNSQPANGHVLPYELIAGERRVRACRAAGRRHVPAIVRELDDRTAAEIALSENVQRSNLSIIEEARGYKQLMLRFRMTEERIAKKVGKSVATIQNTIKLLGLPDEVQAMLAKRQLFASHGHALLPLAPHREVCLSVARHVVANGLSAASLSQTLLPNARELANKCLVQELDWRTKFDWKVVCEGCAFKALVRSGYSAYCLRPDEWHGKQNAAIEQQKHEEARALQQVREEVEEQEEQGRVDVSRLPSSSYRDLGGCGVPPGCTAACPCRREVADPHAVSDEGRLIPICLDPRRLQALREAQRQGQQEERRRHYVFLWTQAVARLQSTEEVFAVAPQTAVLLTALVLRAISYHSGYGGSYASDDATRGHLPRSVAEELGLSLPWRELDEAEGPTLLERLEGALRLNANSEANNASRAPASTETLRAPDPADLLLFAVSLLLASEVQHAVQWAGETPQLDFALGPQGAQGELEMTEAHEAEALARVVDENSYFPDDFDAESEVEAEAETDQLKSEVFSDKADDETSFTNSPDEP